MATNLAVPGALGVAALIAAPWSNPGAPTSMATALTAASSPACYDMVSIAIGGRNDVPVSGTHQFVTAPDGTVLPASMSGDYSSHWFTPIIDAPKGAVGYGFVRVDVHPVPGEHVDLRGRRERRCRQHRDGDPVDPGVVPGHAVRDRRLQRGRRRRPPRRDGGRQPDARAATAPMPSSIPNSVVGVVILADAGRTAGEGQFPGAQNPYGNPDGFDVAYQNGQYAASGAGAMPGTSGSFGALNGKVASFCSAGVISPALRRRTSRCCNWPRTSGARSTSTMLERDGLTEATGADVARSSARSRSRRSPISPRSRTGWPATRRSWTCCSRCPTPPTSPPCRRSQRTPTS